MSAFAEVYLMHNGALESLHSGCKFFRFIANSVSRAPAGSKLCGENCHTIPGHIVLLVLGLCVSAPLIAQTKLTSPTPDGTHPGANAAFDVTATAVSAISSRRLAAAAGRQFDLATEETATDQVTIDSGSSTKGRSIIILSNKGTSAAHTVLLTPGEDIQSAVDAAPERTEFLLLPGIYRMQSVQPKDYDAFIGEQGVILNGSELLSFNPYPGESSLWVASAVAGPADSGICQSAYPLCGYDQDLFIDGKLQAPVSNIAGVQAGSWFFDRGNNRVYTSTDPAGHVIELSMSEFAFYGNATGVKVEGLTVLQYANPAQTGAVGGYKDGTGWSVNHLESEWNHGTGISLGPGSQILNSFSVHNGQMGVAIVNGSDSCVINNEIGWNNYAGYATSWEAGGSKFWNTTNLLVQSNYVHDNNGPGLWTDYDNVGTVYESNTVVDNAGPGIQHEISYDATIMNNTVTGNSSNSSSSLWDSQIVVANSQNVQVYGNTVQVPSGGGNGIGLLNEERGTGSLGVWAASNNYVHNNAVTYLGAGGQSGFVSYPGGPATSGNHFDYDSYTMKDGGAIHWMWLSKMTWSGLLAAGQETHGRCCD